MKKNVGVMDRNIRLAVGSVLLLAGLFVPMELAWRGVLIGAAALAFLTALFGL